MSRCTDSPGAVQASNKRRRLRTPQTAPHCTQPVPRSHCETAPPACQPCSESMPAARRTSPQPLASISTPSVAELSAPSQPCGINSSAAQPSDMMSIPAAQHATAPSHRKDGHSSRNMECHGLEQTITPIAAVQPPQDAAAPASMQQASSHARPASGLNEQQPGLTSGSKDLTSTSLPWHAGMPMSTLQPSKLSDLQPSKQAAAPCSMQACSTENGPAPANMQRKGLSAEGTQQQDHTEASVSVSPALLQLDPKLPDASDTQVPPSTCHVPDGAGSRSTAPSRVVPEANEHPAAATCKPDQPRPGLALSQVVRLVRPPSHVYTTCCMGQPDCVHHADAPVPVVLSAAESVPPASQQSLDGAQLVSEPRNKPCGDHPSGPAHPPAVPAGAGVMSPQRRRVAPEADKENSSPSAAKPSRPLPGLTLRNSHAKMILAAFNASHGAAPHQQMTSPQQAAHGPAPLPCSPPAYEHHAPASGQLPCAPCLPVEHSSRADAHAAVGSPSNAARESLSPSREQPTLQHTPFAAGGTDGTARKTMLALQARSPSSKQGSAMETGSQGTASVSLLNFRSPDARLPANPAGELVLLHILKPAEASLKTGPICVNPSDLRRVS